MKTFKEYITERATVMRMKWDPDPVIGWWRDNETNILYHGTHERNLEYIFEYGLKPADSGYTEGFVSLTLDPNTAYGYASMSGSGGEREFRKAGAKPKHTPPTQRAILILEMNTQWLIDNMAPLRGAMAAKKERLTNKQEYLDWDGQDQEYYQLTEIRIPNLVKPKHIIGWTKKFEDV